MIRMKDIEIGMMCVRILQIWQVILNIKFLKSRTVQHHTYIENIEKSFNDSSKRVMPFSTYHFCQICTSYTHNCKICAHFWNFVLLNLTRHESDIPLLPNHIVQNDPTICLWHWGWTLAVSIYYLIYSTRNLWWRSKPTFT